MLFGSSEDTRGYRGATVTIDGIQYRAIGYPKVSRHLDNLRSSCNVSLDIKPPTFAPGKAVPTWVDMSFDGKGTVRVYTGYLGPVKIPFGARTITLVDNLFKLKNSPEMGCDATEAIFFNDLAPDAAILKILLSAGIAETDIDTASLTTALIAISPTGSINDETLRVCPLMPHCVEVNEKLETLYRDLCSFLCIVGYCDANGKIRFVPKDTRPVEIPPLTFDNDGGYPVLDGERERGGFEDVVRVCTCKLATIQIDGVEGANYTSKWVATAVENGVPYDVSISAPLVQTSPMADRLTTYYGELGCRDEQRFTIETARDPHLKPGMHALFRLNKPDHDPILPDATPGYIVGVEDDGTKSRLTVSTGPSEESGYQEVCLPVAVFSFQVIAETVLIGTPTTIYDVVLDASSSYDPDGAIVSYQWDITGTTPRMFPTNIAQTLAVLNTVTGVSITLTVTDNNATPNTATLTQALDAPDVIIQHRRVQAIKDGQWGVLKDIWLWYTPLGTTATALARYNELGPLWCGCSSGAIYKRSQDDFSQSPELVTTLDASITDIYVGEPFANEAAINSIIVAHGNRVSWTHDAFNTTKSYDFGVAVKCVTIDPFTVEHITVLAGNMVQESWDDGATWTILMSGTEGSVAEDIGVAPWDTCVVFSNATGNNVIRFLSGASWSATLSGEPQTVTPGVKDETFRIATSDSSIYLFDKNIEGNYIGIPIGAIDDDGNTKRLVRDGKFDVVYGADTTQLFKQIANNANHIYPIAMGETIKVGYACLSKLLPPTISSYIYMVPVNQWGNYDVLWRYNVNAGIWDSLTLPAEGKRWDKIVISPYDPKKIVIAHFNTSQSSDTEAYYSKDSGDTWRQISFTVDGNADAIRFFRARSPWKNIIFSSTELFITGDNLNGYAYPYWGTLAVEDTDPLVLNFSTPGYELYHWVNNGNNNCNESADYFGKDGEIFRFLQRNSGSMFQPGSRHFWYTLDEGSWSQNWYGWNENPSIYDYILDSQMYKINGHFIYAVRRGGDIRDGWILCKSAPTTPPPDTSFASSNRKWGYGMCLLNNSIFCIRRAYNVSGQPKWWSGITKIATASIPSIGNCPDGDANEYSPGTQCEDILGRNIVTDGIKFIATMNVSKNHIILYNGSHWETIPLPPNVDSSKVSSFIGIG